MPGPQQIRPDRSVVERVVREETAAHGANLMDVLGASAKPEARSARTAAMSRIMQETGCSHGGLEKVWGSGLRKLARRQVAPAQRHDEVTLSRLAWQYGPDRAVEIISGRDRRTQIDIAKWRRLGGGAAQ